MTEHCLWRLSRALHRAINDQHFDDLAAIIDDHIDWAVFGPIDMFPFLGTRHGKTAVLEACRQIAQNVRLHRYEREYMLLSEDSGSAMMRFSLTAVGTNRAISLRLAQFTQFRAGRLISMRVVVDTFDLVEQALGRAINLPKIA